MPKLFLSNPLQIFLNLGTLVYYIYVISYYQKVRRKHSKKLFHNRLVEHMPYNHSPYFSKLLFHRKDILLYLLKSIFHLKKSQHFINSSLSIIYMDKVYAKLVFCKKNKIYDHFYTLHFSINNFHQSHNIHNPVLGTILFLYIPKHIFYLN